MDKRESYVTVGQLEQPAILKEMAGSLKVEDQQSNELEAEEIHKLAQIEEQAQPDVKSDGLQEKVEPDSDMHQDNGLEEQADPETVEAMPDPDGIPDATPEESVADSQVQPQVDSEKGSEGKEEENDDKEPENDKNE